MVRRASLLVLVVLATVSLSLSQRSGGGAPAGGGSRGGRTGGSGGIPQSIDRTIDLTIHVVYPNDHPAGESIQVDLQVASGGNVGTAFTNGEGEVSFHGIHGGSYVIRLRGPDIKDTSTDIINIEEYERSRHEFVHAEPIEPANAVKSTQGAVSAAELNIPEKARKEFDKGNDAASKRDTTKAVEHYEKAVALYPKFALAYNNLGAVYMQASDPGHARDAFAKALEADPSLPVANANTARLRLMEKNAPEALPLLDKALSTAPNNPEYLLLMAQAQFLSSHYDQAVLYAHKIFALQHEKFEIAHIIAGRALEAQNHPDQARVEYEVLLKEAPAAPESTEARKSLARLDSVAKKR